ncbi:MAG: hypothetical protein B7Z80_12850 [Rhodospirillales bacterium 20-64-7]|nr:MAG: hypothetical protein B7Z80_12850 [Rhodospirillales bacterium 20-64-7]
MESDFVAILRADIAALRSDVNGIRQDIGVLETKADSLEADELVSGLGTLRADIARIRGERDAERRTSLMIISVLSAACGGLIASLFHG